MIERGTNTSNTPESYELIDIDLEQQQRLVLEQEGSPSRNSNDSTESTNSEVSNVFDSINTYVSRSGVDPDDFLTSEGYINGYSKVFKRKVSLLWKIVAILGTILLLVSWIYILLSGPHAAKPNKSLHIHTSEVPSKTAVSTTQEPLVTKSLVPLKEYDIHKSREPIKTRTLDSHIVTNTIQFVPGPTLSKNEDDGFYVEKSDTNYILRKLSDQTYESVIQKGDTFKHQDEQITVETLLPNSDVSYALVSSDVEKEHRHSSIAKYWLLEFSTGTFIPIIGDEPEEKLHHASWSPKFKYITFIQKNDLYIYHVESKSTKRVTKDGTSDILNGKPDWVYEEEVLSSDKSFWWSPDEKNLVFLKIDDTDVRSVELDYYTKQNDRYPTTKRIRYPKTGTTNPLVTIIHYNVESTELSEIDRGDSRLGKDFIVYGATWIDYENFLIRETDRESKILNYRLFNVESNVARVTYVLDSVESYNGWIENNGEILAIPRNESLGRFSNGFIDVLSNNGFNHLAYFKSPEANQPTFLTEGDWEVLDGPIAFDDIENLVYFAANRQSSFERHIYSVDVSTKELTTLTPIDGEGYFEVDFSPSTRFTIFTKLGPQFPIIKSEDSLQERGILDFVGSRRTYHQIEIDKDSEGKPITVNLVELRPENFHENETHPLLVSVYGGPGSQKVNVKFHASFEDSIADKLNAVVLYVDPRGTGGQGWRYRSWARDRIGYYEPRDITNAVEKWISSRSYIDTERTAIWGWSYGGFTTLKTLEFDKGNIFKYGMAVAPVTDWKLYDSIYTERYMGLPQSNEEGYQEAKINNIANFKEVKRFLLMHGSADDNVHIQNTFQLLDQFNLHNVVNYDLHIFPDSNHNIDHHNANSVVMERLTSWISNAYQGLYDSF